MYEPRLLKYAVRGFNVYVPPHYTVDYETVVPTDYPDLTVVR
jgi:hypothetical protein